MANQNLVAVHHVPFIVEQLYHYKKTNLQLNNFGREMTFKILIIIAIGNTPLNIIIKYI